MTGSPASFRESVLSSHKGMAWDVPPIVASPSGSSSSSSTSGSGSGFGGSSSNWKTRSCKLLTPQRIATVLLLSHGQEEDQPSEKVEGDCSDEESQEESLLPTTATATTTTTTTTMNRFEESGNFSSPDPAHTVASTTTSSCPPLLWNQDRIIVALITGEIRVYSLMTNSEQIFSSPVTISTPLSTLTLSSDATIVTMLQIDSNSILVLSVEGHVYQIRVDGLELEHSWNTGSCGGTSMAWDTEGYLVIGYTTGHIECYQFDLSRRQGSRKPTCLWKGWVEEWYSVESLEILRSPSSAEPSASMESNQDLKEETQISQSRSMDPILIVTLQCPVGEENEPPVFHALDMRAILFHVTRSTPSRSSSVQDSSEHLLLSAFRLLPDPAMGILDPSMAKLPPPQKLYPSLIPSLGTNQTISLSGKCGVALSNGTVAILSPGWGIQNDSDQLLLSYPAVGMGTMTWNQTEYLVCCLRAGTSYLIPTSGNSSEIPVVLYPHDTDADTTHVYVQAFTAGLLRQSGTEKGSGLPVLVYMFPGGVIEIYCCHLLSSMAYLPSIEDQVLEEMIQQGCLDLVYQLLGQDLVVVEETNEIWRNAKHEWQQFTTHDIPKSLDDLQNVPALRKLLLHLASTNEDDS